MIISLLAAFWPHLVSKRLLANPSYPSSTARRRWPMPVTIVVTAFKSVASIFGGLLLADFVSGIIHWFEDRYGNPKWPVLGHAIRANQEHHFRPRAFLKGSFLSRNREADHSPSENGPGPVLSASRRAPSPGQGYALLRHHQLHQSRAGADRLLPCAGANCEARDRTHSPPRRKRKCPLPPGQLSKSRAPTPPRLPLGRGFSLRRQPVICAAHKNREKTPWIWA